MRSTAWTRAIGSRYSRSACCPMRRRSPTRFNWPGLVRDNTLSRCKWPTATKTPRRRKGCSGLRDAIRNSEAADRPRILVAPAAPGRHALETLDGGADAGAAARVEAGIAVDYF